MKTPSSSDGGVYEHVQLFTSKKSGLNVRNLFGIELTFLWPSEARNTVLGLHRILALFLWHHV